MLTLNAAAFLADFEIPNRAMSFLVDFEIPQERQVLASISTDGRGRGTLHLIEGEVVCRYEGGSDVVGNASGKADAMRKIKAWYRLPCWNLQIS